MKCLRSLLFIALFTAGMVFPWLASGKTLEGKVLKIFDGDTLLVRVAGRDAHVRLREIDAPETAHRKQAGQEPWGGKSKQFVQSLLRGKTVRLEIEEKKDGLDKYHRVLAYVFSGGTFINEEMVRSGNAFFYPGFHKGKYAAALERAEREAQERGSGIWDPKNGLKERPSEFRKRTQRDEGLFSKFSRLLGRSQGKEPSKEYPAPEGRIVGNKRSMLYHLPESPGAKRVGPKNRVYFISKEEAEKAGFRPAKKP
jgi:micrococcal nuclease